ncbi:GIP, partial [Symbiodinium sp. CCMP2456]
MSSDESEVISSEVISANHGVRIQGLPSLSLWMFLWRQVEIDPANYEVRPKAPPPVKIDGILARIDPELDEIRYGGCPGGRSVANLQGLDVGLSGKFQVQFLEDNQATVTIVSKGDSEKMRHTGTLIAKHFNVENVDILEQVADISTKSFAEKAKWDHALRLINRNRCPDVSPKGGKESDSHLVAKPTIAGFTWTAFDINRA